MHGTAEQPLGPLSSNLLSIMGTSSAFIAWSASQGGRDAGLWRSHHGHERAHVLIEPFMMYALPERAIQALLDPTVEGTVVMVIGLTLTARVGVSCGWGPGAASTSSSGSSASA